MSRLSIVLFLVLILSFFVVVPAYGGFCKDIPVGDPYYVEIDRIPEESWDYKVPVLPRDSIMCYLITMTRFNITYNMEQLYQKQCYCNVTGQWELVGEIFSDVLYSDTYTEEIETNRTVVQCCPSLPSPCPTYPLGLGSVEPRDPPPPGGALCRGACGWDCPFTCGRKSLTQYVWAGDCYYKCFYDIEVCGSHRCCREHDACLDAGRPLSVCNAEAIDCALTFVVPPMNHIKPLWVREKVRYLRAVAICAQWIVGAGPTDKDLIFSDPPTFSGPFYKPSTP